jgi:hypothetical protein
MHTQKMYVLVRKDLSETYRMVQGAHALAQYGLEHPSEFNTWHNSTIVFLGIRNYRDLKEIYCQLLKKKVISAFFEPDLDNQLTAIACYDSGEIFEKFELN